MSHILRLQGQLGDEFATLLPRAADVQDADPALALQINTAISAAAIHTRDRHEAAGAAFAAIAVAEPDPTTRAGRETLSVLALDGVQRNVPAATTLAQARAALAHVTHGGLAELESWSFWYACVALGHSGAPQEEIQILSAGLDAATRLGSSVGVELAAMHRGLARLYVGEVRGAEVDLELSHGASRDGGWAIGGGAKAGIAIQVLLQRGRIDAASALARDWETRRGTSALPWHQGTITWYDTMYLNGRARLEVAGGDPASAIRTIGQIRDALPPAWIGGHVINWRTTLARALHLTGNAEQRDAVLDEAVTLARDFGEPRTLGMTLRASGLCAGGEVGLEQLANAHDLLASSGADLERHWALHDTGVVLHRERRNVDARAPLAEARDWAARFGARRLFDSATQALLAAGARPRRELLRGADALTSRERHIAELAAEGLSNPEIAQRLFVSRRTVEAHLGHAYTKLGVAGRQQLAAALS
jgi:DNA-binding NarL/FixJ family response regulator